MLGIGTFATAVGVGTPLFPAVAIAAGVLNGLIVTFNVACDALKTARTAYLSVKVSGQ
jgi:threonine/homoserine/homoserine lactone efflux protein